MAQYWEVLINKMQLVTLAQQADTANILIQFAPILIIGVIFYLLIFMPMRKRQKKLETMITALRNGDKVITNSGIYGVVAGVKEKTLILKVSDQVKIEIAKSAIAGLQSPDETPQSS
jgi:preprotein translocase subunit YajC